MFFAMGISIRLGTSRVMHAMAIKNALPYSHKLKLLNPDTNCPTYILIFLAVSSNILMFLQMISETAYQALGDLNTAGW